MLSDIGARNWAFRQKRPIINKFISKSYVTLGWHVKNNSWQYEFDSQYDRIKCFINVACHVEWQKRESGLISYLTALCRVLSITFEILKLDVGNVNAKSDSKHSWGCQPDNLLSQTNWTIDNLIIWEINSVGQSVCPLSRMSLVRVQHFSSVCITTNMHTYLWICVSNEVQSRVTWVSMELLIGLHFDLKSPRAIERKNEVVSARP